MPISRDRFESIDSGENEGLPDLSPDTTQGKIYRFLLANRQKAFRQREIIEQVDVPEGSVGPTLKRLREHGMVEHRDRFWSISDSEHASASAVALSAATVDARDDGFTDEERQEWMENAVDPVDEED
jgi:DNA-binding transcriptional MocR family regulator